MVLTNIHYLPITVFIFIPCSFIITYLIAVLYGHVEVEFPYISDTGTHLPESCIFSLAVNLIAFLLASLMYVRYKQIEQHYRDHLSSEFTVVLTLNRFALIFGWLGCFGVCILANFQETAVIVAHMSGALLAFGCAAIYSWLQTAVSHYVYPLLNSMFVARLRVFLSLVLSIAFLTTLVFGIIAHQNFHGKDPMKWNPEDGALIHFYSVCLLFIGCFISTYIFIQGFIAHVVSTGAEWILVISFDFFLLTFVKEMKNISISSPQVHFVIQDLTLQNDFFNSGDQVQIAASQNSLRVSSLPNSPNAEFARDNRLTTQAIVH